jgi:zinc protease
MTVIITQQHAAPIAAAVACFKAGSSLETDSTRGLARALQRMILRGATGKSGDQTQRDLRALGATVSAETSYDDACYLILAQPDRIGNALAILSEMLRSPALDAAELQREIALMIEEEKLSADDPSSLARSRLSSLALPETHFPASEASLRSITREQLVEFHRAHYRPENLVISIAGDVSTFNALISIQQLFAELGAVQTPPAPPARPAQAIKANQPPAAPPPPADPLARLAEEPSSLRYAADRVDGAPTIVSIGYRVPGLKSKERAALEVLAAIAGQGRGSRLYRSLTDEQPLAVRVETRYLALADAGLLSVQMWTAAGLIDKAESTYFREIERLRRELPSEGEMTRAKAMVEKRFTDQTGNYAGRALALARAESAGFGFSASGLDYRKLLRAVTAEDVQRAAATYFILSNTSVHELEPVTAAPRSFDASSFAATAVAWAATIARTVDSKSVRPAENAPAAVAQTAAPTDEELAALESLQPLPVRDFSTINGARAFVREDRSLPTVTVALLFLGGRVAETEATSGLTELMLRTMLSGTPRRARAQTAQELEQLGAEVEIVAEPDFFGLSLSCLSRNSERALRIVRDLIEEPAFRDEDIERARRAQIEAMREGRQSRDLLYQAIYPTHPYSFPAHGREEAVAKITGDQMREWHTRTIKRQYPLAVVVGDTQGSALVSAVIAEGFRRREVDKTIQLRVPQPATPSEKIQQRRGALTRSALGFAGPKGDSADVLTLELIEALLDSTRMKSELRSPGVATREAKLEVEAGLAAGAIYFSVETSSENEQRARAKLLSVIDGLAQTTAEAVASAQALAVTSHLSEWQSQKAMAMDYAREIFYQRDAKNIENFADRVSKTTMEDLKRVAATYFKTNMVYSGVVRGSR